MLKSSLFVSLATFLVSVVGFANQIVLAKLFGASATMDAYLIALSAPILVSGFVSAGLSYSIVPALMAHRSNMPAYRHFAGLLFLSITTVAVVISLSGYMAAPAQIAILGKSLDLEDQQNAVHIARVAWIAAGAVIVVSYLKAAHNAESRFLVATVSSVVPFLCMIAAGLFLSTSYGPLAVAWGMLIGFLLIIPFLLSNLHLNFEISARSMDLWDSVTGYFSRTPLIIAAMLCFTAFQTIDAYWAPQIGTGNLAYLGYCQRLLVAVGNLVIAGPSAVILPRLAAAHAEGRTEDLLRDSERALRLILVFAIPAALAVSILAKPLVRLLFERGAFDHHATNGVAALLPTMMIGMVAMLCVVMVFRALFARHDVVWAAMLGVITAALYFVLSAFLSRSMGAGGIALAYASTWWLLLTLSITILWRGNSALIPHRQTWLFATKLLALGGIVGVVLAGGSQWIQYLNPSDSVLFLLMATVFTVAFVVYSSVAIRILHLEEARLVYEVLSSKLALWRRKP